MNKKPKSPVASVHKGTAQPAHSKSAGNNIPSVEELLHELNVHQIELEMQNEELRKNQLLLEESRDQYSNLYDFAPVGYLTLNRSGLIDKINLAGADLLRVERSKLLHKPLATFVAESHAGLWHVFFMRALKSLERLNCELSFKVGGGFALDVRLDCQTLNNGGVQSLLISLTDITERKRFIKELIQSREEYEKLYNHAPCGFHSLDANGRIIGVNQTEAGWLGYTQDELMGKHITEIQAPSSAEYFAQDFSRFKRDGYVESIEVHLLRKNGTPLTVLMSSKAEYDNRGNYVKNRTSLINITARKRVENALRNSEERFRQLFEKAPIGIAIAKQDQLLFTANAAFCTMFGYTAEELTHLTISDLTHHDYRDKTRQLSQDLLGGGIPLFSFEKKYLRKDGSSFWGKIIATEITGNEPHSRMIMGMVEDITERVEKEQLRLHEVHEQRDVLVREVHHRIKNNLQGVVGLLRQNASDHPQMAEVIAVTIGRIYSIAIIHGLQAETVSEAVNLDRLLLSIVDASEPCIDYQNKLANSVLLNQEEAVPIALVLNELLTNACKHRCANSRVSLAMSHQSEGTLIGISNTTDEDPQLTPTKGQGLNLVKSLLPRRSAVLSMVHAGNIFTAELKLSPPVTIASADDVL
jgi:PAS domain S-box-containing protein